MNAGMLLLYHVKDSGKLTTAFRRFAWAKTWQSSSFELSFSWIETVTLCLHFCETHAIYHPFCKRYTHQFDMRHESLQCDGQPS